MTHGLVFRINKKAKVEEQQIPQQTGEGSSETPNLDLNTPGIGETHKPTNEEEVVSDSGIKEIVLRAPIGHAVTQALEMLFNRNDNKTGVLRTESNMTQVLVNNIAEAEIEENLSPSDVNKAYIFVYDGRRMNLGEIDAMASMAERAKNNAAEYVGVLVDNIPSVEEDKNKHEFISQMALHLESVGVKVHYTGHRTISTLEKWLEVDK